MILLVGATSEETKPETKLRAGTFGMGSMTSISLRAVKDWDPRDNHIHSRATAHRAAIF